MTDQPYDPEGPIDPSQLHAALSEVLTDGASRVAA